MRLTKRLAGLRPVQNGIAFLGAEYLRLVWNTTRLAVEPEDAYERGLRDSPVILATWHGQHFLAPFLKAEGERAKALISRHRDGEINAIIAERLGIGTIRGSAAPDGRYMDKGGASAFVMMLRALKEGYNVALSADVPKIARVAGLGIVKLASVSGRPIYPFALVTNWRKELKNWDRTAINLPFGRGALVTAEPIRVAAKADEAALEGARSALEKSLDAILARAYVIATRR